MHDKYVKLSKKNHNNISINGDHWKAYITPCPSQEVIENSGPQLPESPKTRHIRRQKVKYETTSRVIMLRTNDLIVIASNDFGYSNTHSSIPKVKSPRQWIF
jgi:hypothetical protein